MQHVAYISQAFEQYWIENVHLVWLSLNPRTYMQSHTSTTVQGRWFDGEPIPWVFIVLQYSEEILPLVDSL